MAGGEETCGKVSKGLSADGRGRADAVRQHRGTREGTRHQRVEMKVIGMNIQCALELIFYDEKLFSDPPPILQTPP